MKRVFCFPFLIIFLFSGCADRKDYATASFPKPYEIVERDLNLFDSSRNRLIPLALYYPRNLKNIKHPKLVLISHGYNVNQGNPYKGYSSIARGLASKGYYVASIQHELVTDSLLPSTGTPQIVRKSNWERGVANIRFVLQSFKKINPGLDYKHVILIGHSNGGDMSMLFAQKYPDLVDKVISLDNRRVALPRTSHPKVCSIRSSDQPADEEVLPTAAEQRKYGMIIYKLENTIHNDMGDNGTELQRQEINTDLQSFLNDK